MLSLVAWHRYANRSVERCRPVATDTAWLTCSGRKQTQLVGAHWSYRSLLAYVWKIYARVDLQIIIRVAYKIYYILSLRVFCLFSLFAFCDYSLLIYTFNI